MECYADRAARPPHDPIPQEAPFHIDRTRIESNRISTGTPPTHVSRVRLSGEREIHKTEYVCGVEGAGGWVGMLCRSGRPSPPQPYSTRGSIPHRPNQNRIESNIDRNSPSAPNPTHRHRCPYLREESGGVPASKPSSRPATPSEHQTFPPTCYIVSSARCTPLFPFVSIVDPIILQPFLLPCFSPHLGGGIRWVYKEGTAYYNYSEVSLAVR